ncbi:MAG: hypothetical protein ACRCTG_10990 [Aestuariivirga sp.]
MAWIESHTVLARHRKTIELAFDLQVKPVQVVGHLHVFWHTVLEQQEDGDLSQWSDQLIAQAALWEGDATVFVTRLRERGWLDGHLVHDWIDYTGPYLTKKYSSGNPTRLREIWAKYGYKYGKGQGKYSKQKATSKRVNSERDVRLPNPSLPNLTSPNPSLPNLSEPDQREVKSGGQVRTLPAVPKSAATWEAYAGAYRRRYGVEPVRNSKTNAQLCQLVDRLGAQEAPEVAAFYVTHNKPLYVSARHPANLLVQDAEGLRTQWATGVKATTRETQSAEQKDNMREQYKRVMATVGE